MQSTSRAHFFLEARVESGERLLEVRPCTWLSNPTAARIEKSAARINPLLGVFPPGIAKTCVPRVRGVPYAKSSYRAEIDDDKHPLGVFPLRIA